MTGRTASWSDLLISFSITRKSIITLTILSSTTEIGTVHIPIKSLLTLTPTPEGHIATTHTVYSNEVNHGTVTLTLHIDRLNRFGFNESDIIPENVFHASDLDHSLRLKTADGDVPGEGTSKKRRATDSADSIDRDAKHFKTHNIAVSPITIPFVLRIVRVQCLDMAPDLRQHLTLDGNKEVPEFSNVSAVLNIRLDNWSKHTPACATPLDTSNATINNANTNANANTTVVTTPVLAEWADPDWVFIITNPNSIFHFSLLSQHLTIGELTLSVGDCATCLPSKRGLVELVLYVFRGVVPCGKVRVCMSISSYVSPEHMLSNNENVTPRNLTTVELDASTLSHDNNNPLAITNDTVNNNDNSNTLGVLRIKSIAVNDLYQIYGLFPNSPKVSIHFGAWSSSTSTAIDAGSDFTWEFTNWGRIPILENAVFLAKITSGNETLGIFQISALEILELNGYKSEENVYVEGDILDGMVIKGRFSMCVIPTLLNSAEYMLYNNIVPSEDDHVHNDGSVQENTSILDTGVGAQKSWISDDSHSPETGELNVMDGETVLNTLRNSRSLVPTDIAPAEIASPNVPLLNSSTSNSSALHETLPRIVNLNSADTHHSVASQNHNSVQDLSLSTPTPDITLCSILGISIFNCKSVSAIFRNSPHVVVTCDAFTNKTNTARFAGASANWILRKHSSWEITMRAATFVKISVYSNGSTLVGSVCINTRELIVVPRDAQGLTVVMRDLEHNLEITGKVRLVMNLAFSMEKVQPVPQVILSSFIFYLSMAICPSSILRCIFTLYLIILPIFFRFFLSFLRSC